MARKKSNSPSSKAVVVTMVAALVGVAAIAAYVKMTPGASRVADDMRANQETVSRPAGPSVEVKTAPRHGRSEVPAFLVPALDGTEVRLLKPVSPTPEGIDAKAHLVTETLKSFGVSDGRALQCTVKDKVATIDVNAAVAEHGYGSTEEGNLVKALQLALGQFPDVESFVLLQDGHPIELGHLDLSEPIMVTRPNASAE